jgi:hypothetical protein
MVEYQQIQRLWQGISEAVQPELERTAVELWQFEKAVRSRRWFNGAIQREIVKLVRHRGDGLDPAGRHPTPDHGQYPQPGFVLGKNLERVNRRVVGKLLGEEGWQGGLKLGYSVRTFFAWEGRGRCGLACSLYRTRAWTRAYAKDT